MQRFFQKNSFSYFLFILCFLILSPHLSFGMDEFSDKAPPAPHAFNIKSVPAEIPIKLKDKELIYIAAADLLWHQKTRELVNQSFHVLERICGNPPDPYNVATFQISTTWSDGQVKRLAVPHTLFLSKMSLGFLFSKVKESATLKDIKLANVITVLQKNYGLDAQVKNFSCFGHYFPSAEGVSSGLLARQFVAGLFDLQELKENREKGQSPRKKFAQNCMNDLREKKEEIYNALISGINRPPNCLNFCFSCFQNKGNNCNECKTCNFLDLEMRKRFDNGWDPVKDIFEGIYDNVLYTLLPFTEKSNNTTKRYFKGKTVADIFLTFDQNFADSEQAIYQFLLDLDNKLEKKEKSQLNNNNPKNPTKIWTHKFPALESISIDIVSYRPMCEFCEGTAQRLIEKGEIVNAIKNSLNRKDDRPGVYLFVSYINDKFQKNPQKKDEKK